MEQKARVKEQFVTDGHAATLLAGQRCKQNTEKKTILLITEADSEQTNWKNTVGCSSDLSAPHRNSSCKGREGRKESSVAAGRVGARGAANSEDTTRRADEAALSLTTAPVVSLRS